MSKRIFYRQCGYEQEFPLEGEGTKFDVYWIPENLAKVGQIVYFGEKRKPAREELYCIKWVGDNRRSAEWLHDKQQADRNQRKASDI